MNDNFFALLGFARKAGKLSAGASAVTDAVKSKKAKLVIIGEDISPKSEKEIRFFAKEEIPVIRVNAGICQLSAAIGKNAGIISVNDDRFSKAITDGITTGGTAYHDKK